MSAAGPGGAAASGPKSPVWAWRLLDERGKAAATSPEAGSRFDAEAWLGEHWRTAAERGAASAQLLRSGERVGAPVPLRAFDLGE